MYRHMQLLHGGVLDCWLSIDKKNKEQKQIELYRANTTYCVLDGAYFMRVCFEDCKDRQCWIFLLQKLIE